ncbi:peptidoglycan DD-metalloendopeptidase family protein [[Haemophilus] ducreyi]|uniref:peptidoglycan DD-metalloendopeptidase family protein n=1 Tax=Haemophilus ducreyi TaxID=730 RepID=UPI0006566717|nr:peptidoglycan DD-metalloendopeptidase family protein [[Haemophilus] ducreyi]AKO45202.1 membrane protein [[Haemophilus] ducreyi]AKO46604.1 membrane protein [[Haemophilus] ducreyi]AKO47945.1 membrane protein [[Haemophilus] ducreyi]AKO49333.1 membrane protein [[Haemophilus] ducreyi]ANF61666.1 hypothetical protein A6037_02355 [[Haemophilus] ducreyi]
MKSSFLLLPLATLIITACSANTPAPIMNASNQNAIAQNDYNQEWQTDLPSAPMENTMAMPETMPTMPMPTTRTVPAQVLIPSQPIGSINNDMPLATQKVNQDFVIPRDANNVPVYSQIQKGFYDGDSYTVRKGDTMFLIAYIVGKDVKEIARLNNMQEPYHLAVGQKIKTGKKLAVTTPTSPPQMIQSANTMQNHSVKPFITAEPMAKVTTNNTPATMPVTSPAANKAVTKPAITPVKVTTVANSPNATFKWQWPTVGRILAAFSATEGGNKGLDIAGNKGQAIKAAADGKVVYAGNVLEGYGHLIIIKHSNDFLSAYAHNESIKVKEKDMVKAGQIIAKMGNTGTNTHKLHFEIRYKGKSVDPIRYLPIRP